jgi:chitin disaccharide deacetylase
MPPNPVLQKLGFSETDRVVIFHADDIGMCQSSLAAYRDLLNFGVLSAAATMVPCPWFPATAAFCREQANNGRLDMGVHLTLNSEWSTFRWGPLSSHDAASGLLDDEGYFYNNTRATQLEGAVDAVHLELQTQIERALSAGVDATHIDSHMFAIFYPKFLPVYFDLARYYRLPAFMLRADEERLRQIGYPSEEAITIAQILAAAEASGLPLLDHVIVLPLEPVSDRLAHARKILAELPAGITYFVIHPCHDTPELRAMAPDWEARVQDYQLFTSEAWRQAVQESGVHVIGYKAIRDLIRA